MPTPLEDLEPHIIELQRVLEGVQDAIYNQIWSTTLDSQARQTLEKAHNFMVASADALAHAHGMCAGALVDQRLDF